MTNLFIDLRGKCTRALIAEGERILFARTFPRPLESGEDLAELIGELAAKAGKTPDQAHLIVPVDEVKLSTYKLQEMPLEDAGKIIQRGISAATGVREPNFHLTLLAPQQDKQVYLAEHVAREFFDAHVLTGDDEVPHRGRAQVPFEV